MYTAPQESPLGMFRSALIVLLTAAALAACGGSSKGGDGDDDGGPGDEIDAGGGGTDAGEGCGLVTCESAGATCGPIGDGCGGIIECGDCDAPETCGGGGTPSVCGGDSGCVPQDCDDVGAECGPIGDGCGDSIASCGECDDGEACGGGGPSICGAAVPCVNLCEDQVDCPNVGETTSVSGTVYTPAGDLPLYNIRVYVPNAPLDPIPTGNDSCDSCDAPLSGQPLVRTKTDVEGNFVLEDMPVGDDIPLVIQSGKWRRLITIPTVTACVDTPLDAALTRFPREQGEFGVIENNIPKIALTTGGADALECLMRKIGIADTQFTNPAGAGRVNLYAGSGGTDRYRATLNGGAAFPAASTLWDDVADLDNYDMVVLSCEGAGDDPGNRPNGSYQAMKDYLDDHSGRVFGSHWHHAWVENGPAPFPDIATENHRNDLPDGHTVTVNDTFTKGAAMAQWLLNVAASTVLGELDLVDGQHTIDAVNPDYATTWIFGTNPNPDNDDDNEPPQDAVQYYSFNTPAEEDDPDLQCGKMVVTDIHVSAGDDSATDIRFPNVDDDGDPDGCTSTGLLPEEKALIFMLFDLASCVNSDTSECDPRECADVNAECGPIADGCGDLVDCGPCEEPGDTCGGGGVPNQCGNDGCVPTDCAMEDAECGPIADGCGETIDCGPCEEPETCGGSGVANECGGGVVD